MGSHRISTAAGLPRKGLPTIRSRGGVSYCGLQKTFARFPGKSRGPSSRIRPELTPPAESATDPPAPPSPSPKTSHSASHLSPDDHTSAPHTSSAAPQSHPSLLLAPPPPASQSCASPISPP